MAILNNERYITVTDDWYPCYKGHKVKLSLALCFFKNYYIKLSVWGADDFGLEIEENFQNESEAMIRYEELEPYFRSIPNGKNKQWFREQGFKPF